MATRRDPNREREPFWMWLYRRASGLWPTELRRRHEREAIDDVRDLLADEAQRGRVAASRLWGRAMADALGTAVRERRLDRSRASLWSDLGGDVRYVFRSWRRSPGFAATAVATLTVGLGLGVAVFTFADGYLFRPLPFASPDQLYGLHDPASEPVGMVHMADVLAMKASDLAPWGFVEWGAGGLSGASLVIGDRHVTITSYGASEGFAETLRLPMSAGRWFAADDYRQTSPLPVWISDKFWDAEFGRDPRVVGQRLHVIGATTSDVQIIGVMGPLVSSFDLNNAPPDIVVPGQPPTRTGPFMFSDAIVRLPAGMTRAQGEARLNAAYHALPPPGGPRPWSRGVIHLQSLRERQVSGGRPTARVLLTGAMLVLLLVGANLVHLLLARGAARAGEISIRGALGASRWRTVRLFLTESVMLGAIGIAGGLGVGRWLSLLIANRVPTYPTRGRNLALVPMIFDLRVIGFAIIVGVVLVLFGGWWPAWRATHLPAGQVGRGQGGASIPLRTRVARTILASELALATVVLTGAVFLGMGISRFLNQPLGFDYHDRFAVSVEGSSPRGSARSALADLTPVVGDLARVSGVVAVTPARAFGSQLRNTTVVVGEQELPQRAAMVLTVGPGAFRTWGITLREGRLLTDEEIASGAPMAVVDEKFARLAWPQGMVLGQMIQTKDTSGAGPRREVVGVIAPVVRRLDMDTAAEVYVPTPMAAFSLAAVPVPAPAAPGPPPAVSSIAPVVTLWAPGVTAESLRERVAAVVGHLSQGGFLRVEPLTFANQFERESGEALFQAPIVTAFGVLAFVVAGVGLFGLVSYVVERRLREFGIRIALGARPAHLWAYVVRESLWPSLAGLGLGLIAARALDLLVQSKVFGWAASGLLAATIVGVLLIGVALSASIGPARRAMRVDPLDVLRAE
jgi:putative ABC transport system permease protein